MFTKKRQDGTYLGKLHFFAKLMPYLMPTRTEATIFYEQEFNITKTLEYVREKVAHGAGRAQVPDGSNVPALPKISVFFIVLYAAIRVIAQRPKMNRFISGYRFYQRNRISFNFVAKRDLSDEGEEINVTMSFSPLISLHDFCKKVNDYLSSLKKGSGTETEKINSFLVSLPRFCIKGIFRIVKFLDYHNALPMSAINSLPFYSTVFFTNVGSVGIDAPFHHNFEIGNCGIFCAVGKIRRENRLSAEGNMEKIDVVKLTFTFDDRITDGIYCARAVEMVRDLVENPEKLEIPLELSPDQISALCLSPKELAE